MLIIKRNQAGQQQVIFAKSGIVAVTFPNRQLCKDWIEENYPEHVEGTPQYVMRLAAEAVKRGLDTIAALNEPIPVPEQLNASVGRSVWRARD